MITMKNIETISVNTTSVSCSGSIAPSDHPTVYLKIDPVTNIVICPYCNRKFIKSAK